METNKQPTAHDAQKTTEVTEKTKSDNKVVNIRSSVATGVGNVLGWIDQAADNIAENVGDAVVEGTQSFFRRLWHWKTTKKHAPNKSQSA